MKKFIQKVTKYVNKKYLAVGVFLGSIVVFTYIMLNPGGVVSAAIVELDTQTANQIQIDVANRYRAIMTTNEVGSPYTDYLVLYDRAENDSSPDDVFKLEGFRLIDEGTTYRLSLDENRKTTILEASSSRVRLRVEGCAESTGPACALDEDDDETIRVIEEYTFTNAGVFVNTKVDLRADGLDLDSIGGTDYVYVNTAHFNSNVGEPHSETILYGDGETESSRSTDGNTNAVPDEYVVVQGTGSYQDVVVSALRLDGDKFLSTSSDASIYLDIDTSSERDKLNIWDVPDQTLPAGTADAMYGIQFHTQADLDTEAEREALFNNLTNPDFPAYTTGTEWNDAAGNTSFGSPSSASPGLMFDGTDDYVAVSDPGAGSVIDFGDTDPITISMWIYPTSFATRSTDYVTYLAKGNTSGSTLANYMIQSIDGCTTDCDLRFAYRNAANDTWHQYVSDNNVLVLNKWQHVAVSYIFRNREFSGTLFKWGRSFWDVVREWR